MYSKKVMEHFKNPKNLGRIENPDGIGKVGNVVCGDLLHLYIKVGKKEKNEIIKDVKFETYGCTAAIATSSMITELVKGKTLEKAANIKKDDIVKALGGLPSIKIHCSVLAVDALSEAVYDYLSKNYRKIPNELMKKHGRNVQEKEIVQEKYKDWIGNQEQMRKHK